MATLQYLKETLREKAASASIPKQPLSDTEYSAGFDILLQDAGWTTYQDFIIPQLSQLLTDLFKSRQQVSVLEIGPGPRSVLGFLPDHLRQKIKRYTAYEPNGLFFARLKEWFGEKGVVPFPGLESTPDIRRCSFTLDSSTSSDGQKYDLVLFCHSMYGMNPKQMFIERALAMLVERPEGGMVVVFHREGTLHLDGLACYRTASFPIGVVRVADHSKVLDAFASFIAGFGMHKGDMQCSGMDEAVLTEWRDLCRALARREDAHPNHLLFSSPDVMVAFTRHATALPELMAQMISVKDRIVKNHEARLHRPAATVRPTEIPQIQHCVRWALKHGVGLTVIGGGHSGHCLLSNVVSVDLGAFDQVHVLTSGEDACPVVVAEAGCTAGNIVHKAMAAGLAVPLGARPSVGAGLWLQGGIGHLARLHGLACDAIVGAVVVSVDSGEVLCVGRVPSQHRPPGAVVRPENEADLLWATKGAGTNFGIVVSVVFKACAARTYSVRNWVVPLRDSFEACHTLERFGDVARMLPRHCSADVYLYCEDDQLRLGVTEFYSSAAPLTSTTSTPTPTWISEIFGRVESHRIVDSVGLFDTEMYMSGMHGGHGGGKTSSFKRCFFLKDIGSAHVAGILVAAVKNRPSPLCYLHLLQGGGAVGDVGAEATAFGCRDWDFACVVTGVWPRERDEAGMSAQAAVRWVYAVAKNLLPFSTGAYGADLGPDPRDAELAARAFGPNRLRLARLKRSADPRDVLAYACPLPRAPVGPGLVVLVTGDSCAGKDYCAGVWVSVLAARRRDERGPAVRAVSISEATKQEYAAATGADLNRLLGDRPYKEEHRPALTAFFQDQVRRRPRLPEEHFLNVVCGNADLDVLIITGMRDQAPVANLSHLVPDSRLVEVRVQASEGTRRARRDCHLGGYGDKDSDEGRSSAMALDRSPSFIFDNDASGDEAVKKFAHDHLLPFLHEDLQRLAGMVSRVPDFPRPGIEFRHVLDIAQQPGGIALCTSLLQAHFAGDWARVDAVVCCEAGGFVFAPALAARVGVRLALIREAGRLPLPTVSVAKPVSHISSSSSSSFSPKHALEGQKRIEMGRDVLARGASVVVVDDVLATGRTLCALLQLLEEAGIAAADVSVLVVAEFPVHRGRERLRRGGFGMVRIQSLLVFGGA